MGVDVGNGDTDLIVGNLTYKLHDRRPLRTWLTFWENRGLKGAVADADRAEPEHVINIFSGAE